MGVANAQRYGILYTQQKTLGKKILFGNSRFIINIIISMVFPAAANEQFTYPNRIIINLQKRKQLS